MEKRIKGILIGVVAGYALSLYAATKSWWLFYLPSTTVGGPNGLSAQGVSARKGITLGYLTQKGVEVKIFGFPQLEVLSLLVLLTAVIAVVTSKGIFSLVGIGLCLWDWNNFNSLIKEVDSSSPYIHLLSGNLFPLALLVMLSSSALVTVQVFWMVHLEKIQDPAYENRWLKFAEHLWQMQARRITRLTGED